MTKDRFDTVLIVDDDPLQAALLAAYCEEIGMNKIIEIQQASEALEILKSPQAAVDLVISDLQMPGMDGLEFMRHLKVNNYKGKLVIASGLKNDLLSHAARLAKMHDLDLIGQVSKPLSKDALDLVFLRNNTPMPIRRDQEQRRFSDEEFVAGMERREIRPYYQPKINVATGKIAGAEALVRWILPDGHMITPDALLTYVEEKGQMRELTFYLFERVLDDLPEFLEISPDISIAINIAPGMIGDPRLPDELVKRTREAGISAKNISFEVTEDRILQLDTTTLEVLSRLRVSGFDVAIDDFGTGSSNIQTLRDFPYSELKIDRAFISNAIQNTFSRETVFAAVALAHDLGMKVVAEGVENRSTFNLIRDLGIEYAQGFLVARALPPRDFEKFLVTNHNGVSMIAA